MEMDQSFMIIDEEILILRVGPQEIQSDGPKHHDYHLSKLAASKTTKIADVKV